METLVESAEPHRVGASALMLRLLGDLTVMRNGVPLGLPASRKLRALLAYLALAPRPVSRDQLCALLWDVPNDPRGEVRWSLSKLRGLLDEEGRRRVVTAEDKVTLDLAGFTVDAHLIADAAAAGIETLDSARLRELASLFAGDFLAGLELDRCPDFAAWTVAQRRRFRALHVAVLERLAQSASGDEEIAHLEKWIELAPFDPRPHGKLLASLAARGPGADGPALRRRRHGRSAAARAMAAFTDARDAGAAGRSRHG